MFQRVPVLTSAQVRMRHIERSVLPWQVYLNSRNIRTVTHRDVSLAETGHGSHRPDSGSQCRNKKDIREQFKHSNICGLCASQYKQRVSTSHGWVKWVYTSKVHCDIAFWMLVHKERSRGDKTFTHKTHRDRFPSQIHQIIKQLAVRSWNSKPLTHPVVGEPREQKSEMIFLPLGTENFVCSKCFFPLSIKVHCLGALVWTCVRNWTEISEPWSRG